MRVCACVRQCQIVPNLILINFYVIGQVRKRNSSSDKREEGKKRGNDDQQESRI